MSVVQGLTVFVIGRTMFSHQFQFMWQNVIMRLDPPPPFWSLLLYEDKTNFTITGTTV